MRRLLGIGMIFIAGAALAAEHVESVAATLEDAARERVWDGRVEAVNRATISAQTSGRIAELPFDVNDYVDAGSVVMRFTDTEQQAALASALARAACCSVSVKRITTEPAST